MPFFVYKLIDYTVGINQGPELVFWVGQCEDIIKRFKQHLGTSSPRIANLAALGTVPLIKTIEVLETRQEALAREKFWLRHFLSAGHPLENGMLPSVRARPPGETLRRIKREPEEDTRVKRPYHKSLEINKEQLGQEIIRLYAEERLGRGEILKRLHLGTAWYGLLKETLDIYEARKSG